MSTRPFQITKNDRRTSIAYVLRDDGLNNDITGATVTFSMYDESGTVVVDAGSCTVQPTTAFTVDTATDRILANAHGVQDGWEIVVANSGGSLPTGLSASTRYFAINATANHFQVATEKGGIPVDITAAGSGTHTFYILGHVYYAWTANDVDTAGTYKGWFTVTAGGKADRFPNDRSGIAVHIFEVP